jgi:predicted lysophospholipase L1 biosynthesis ABC-type transport system permease subunit
LQCLPALWRSSPCTAVNSACWRVGAARLYIFLCVWGEIAFIAIVGAVLGLALGTGAVPFVSYMITHANLPAEIGTNELLIVADMILFGVLVSTIPAFVSHPQSVIQALNA